MKARPIKNRKSPESYIYRAKTNLPGISMMDLNDYKIFKYNNICYLAYNLINEMRVPN